MFELISKDYIKEKCEKDPEQAFEELLKTYPGKQKNSNNYMI